jgi:hypothetical protein
LAAWSTMGALPQLEKSRAENALLQCGVPEWACPELCKRVEHKANKTREIDRGREDASRNSSVYGRRRAGFRELKP